VPADDRDMMLVFAHAGHWYHSLLYLAPLIVLVGLALAGRLRDPGE
jgi:hypothetical protein